MSGAAEVAVWIGGISGVLMVLGFLADKLGNFLEKLAEEENEYDGM